jgi:Putative peptidoglycan binding domain/Transglycosylase SLT domain
MRTRPIAWALACLLAVGATLPALAVTGGVSIAAASQHLGDRVLSIGMSGDDVRALQQLLTKRGFRLTADGQFGPLTRAAVMRAQRAYGIAVDGVVGPQTLGALKRGNPPKSRHKSSSKRPCSSSPGSGDWVTRWRPVVKCVLGMLHQSKSSSNVNDVFIIIRFESGGNPRAINGTDINAQNGDPSRGLMQTIGATFNAYRSHKLKNDIYDPAANIYAGINYGISRYGSIGNIPGVKSILAGHGYVPYRVLQRTAR